MEDIRDLSMKTLSKLFKNVCDSPVLRGCFLFPDGFRTIVTRINTLINRGVFRQGVCSQKRQFCDMPLSVFPHNTCYLLLKTHVATGNNGEHESSMRFREARICSRIIHINEGERSGRSTVAES